MTLRPDTSRFLSAIYCCAGAAWIVWAGAISSPLDRFDLLMLLPGLALIVLGLFRSSRVPS